MVFLLHGDSYHDQDLYYASRFLAFPVTYLSADGGVLLVSGMERSRAEEESKAGEVRSLDDFGYDEKLGEMGKSEAYASCVADLLREKGLEEVEMPPDGPAFLHDHLSTDFRVEIEDSILQEERREKSEREVEAVESSVLAAENAIEAAVEAIEEAEPEGDELRLDGEVLTAESLRRRMEHTLVDRGCLSVDMIAAPGRESHKPHWRGEGPIENDSTLVLDVFPRDRGTRYCGDMTRTLVVGENPEVEEMRSAVREALETVEAEAGPGESCAELHSLAEKVLEDEGFETADGEGFVHGLGHGIGLDIHEDPRLSGSSTDTLREGDVVTLEPGLYYEGVGGVRLEDTFAVEEDGVRRLSTADRILM